MTTEQIGNLSVLRASILCELDLAKGDLETHKNNYDKSVRNVDQLASMALNLDLTIKIMKEREAPCLLPTSLEESKWIGK